MWLQLDWRQWFQLVNEKIHLVNEKQTLTAAAKNWWLQWKQRSDVDSLREPYVLTLGTRRRRFTWGCRSVPGTRELALVQPFPQISIWTTGIPAPPWKGNTTMGDIDLLSICPRLGDIPFNCMAKTGMEQEIMEDITAWSWAKSAPSPSLPRMECRRIEGL